MTHEHNKLVRFAQLLTRSQERITIEPDKAYQQITVRLWGKGVVERGVIQGSQIAAPSQFVARSGQFIISRIDARNGAFGLVPATLDGAVVTNDFPIFFVNTEEILPEFLAWMSKTQHFVDLCIAASEGTTNRVRLQEERFLAAEITLPPLDEQRRIVARIEALAGRVAEAQRLRQQAVEEAKALTESYTDKILVELASKFESRKFSEICTTITDGDHITPQFSTEGIKFIFVGNVSSGHLHFNNCKYVTEEYFAKIRPQRIPKRGDILYSAVGATLGVPALVDVNEPFCFQRHIAILKPNPDLIDSRFAWHLLHAGQIYRKAWSLTTGSAQPTIPLKAIRSLEIPLPPIQEQHQIVTYLDDLYARVDTLKRLQTGTFAELDALLPAILDKAFRGEL